MTFLKYLGLFCISFAISFLLDVVLSFLFKGTVNVFSDIGLALGALLGVRFTKPFHK